MEQIWYIFFVSIFTNTFRKVYPIRVIVNKDAYEKTFLQVDNIMF